MNKSPFIDEFPCLKPQIPSILKPTTYLIDFQTCPHHIESHYSNPLKPDEITSVHAIPCFNHKKNSHEKPYTCQLNPTKCSLNHHKLHTTPLKKTKKSPKDITSKSNEPSIKLPGWWFGTCFCCFSILIGSVIIPTNFHIFHSGGSTTNQLPSIDDA